LKILEHHPLINEIIVVNDGSADATSEVIKKFNVTLVENEKNMGKTLSIKKGIELAKNELIMLVDADLIGLTAESINLLVRPVIEGKVDWTLSLRSNSFKNLRFLKFLNVDWLSGERVIPRVLLLDPLIWSRPDIGYGLEALMNKSLLSKKKTFLSILIPGVTNPTKAQKDSFFQGIIFQARMVIQISKVVSVPEVTWQLFKMIYLNHKYAKKLMHR
jgi:glycosyltransferase involved in cell wall biosynthesis